jgi:hypothetical protein
MTDTDAGKETIRLVHDLHKTGASKFSIILRHSLRHYDDKIHMEPFMGLTEQGKDQCVKIGMGLPRGMTLRLFSSHFGRCIETAYLMDQGYLAGGGDTKRNQLVRELSPFYVNDFEKALETITTLALAGFIRSWIEGEFSPDILMDAREVADRIFFCAIRGLTETGENNIDVLVTHDWNMYLLKEFGLGLTHEDHGEVDFLEGVVLFEKEGEIYLTHHQAEPKRLDSEYLSRIRGMTP